MKILYIENSYPIFSSIYCGGAVRSRVFLESLRKIGNTDVVSFMEEGKDIQSGEIERFNIIYSHLMYDQSAPDRTRYERLARILKPWNTYSLFPVTRKKEEIIDTIISQAEYDCIVVRYIQSAISCGLLKYSDKLVVDVDDNPKNFSLSKLSLNVSMIGRIYTTILSYSIGSMVKRLVKNIKLVFYSNITEPPLGKKRKENIVFLPNISFYEKPLLPCNYDNMCNNILFVGSMYYHPNYLGMDYFLENIFPKVTSVVPDATISIVGKGVPDNYQTKWSKYPNVIIKGFVPDLEKEYINAKLVVLPIYQGSGTAIKLLESMFMFRPCVSSPKGVRGYEKYFTEDEDYLLANDPDSFADSIIDLLKSQEFNHRICSNAYAKMSKFFSQDNFNKIVKTSIEAAIPIHQKP